MNKAIMVFICFWSLAVTAEESCSQWPPGLVFVGLTNQGWQTYAVTKKGAAPHRLAIKTEVRTPVLSLKKNALYYIDETSRLMQFSLQNKTTKTLLTPSPSASYTQPEMAHTHNALYLVELKQGKSVDTDIVRFDLDSQLITPLITQLSSQFEPSVSSPWIYFNNVHCVVGCGKIIQELWRYHPISGISEQLTLLNAISRQPVADSNNEWLYFSSNAESNYHLYRIPLKPSLSGPNGMTPEQLTTGAAMDTSPAIAGKRIYFIRQETNRSTLMCGTVGGEWTSLPLPEGVTQLRDLEI